ncbi:MAG: hypothetical protein EOO59_14690 [Hymenobacter sp.]|nr:MAG: hypothetical protein EOO59_14690 [Hymenobacter sp.]
MPRLVRRCHRPRHPPPRRRGAARPPSRLLRRGRPGPRAPGQASAWARPWGCSKTAVFTCWWALACCWARCTSPSRSRRSCLAGAPTRAWWPPWAPYR